MEVWACEVILAVSNFKNYRLLFIVEFSTSSIPQAESMINCFFIKACASKQAITELIYDLKHSHGDYECL